LRRLRSRDGREENCEAEEKFHRHFY
jgi:hypothetical protein